MSEVKVLKAIWHNGKPVDVESVIDVHESDADYLVGIGRVERIETESPNTAPLDHIPVILKRRKVKE